MCASQIPRFELIVVTLPLLGSCQAYEVIDAVSQLAKPAAYLRGVDLSAASLGRLCNSVLDSSTQ